MYRRWGEVYSERFAARIIGIDSCFGLFAIHVLFKLINIQSDRARIRFEQFARIGSLAPNGLFAIEHVVHLPKMTLEPSGFSSQRGLPSVLVSAEREIRKMSRTRESYSFSSSSANAGETAAGRALKIAKLFQRHRGIGVAPNVH